MSTQDLQGPQSTQFFTKTWTPPSGVPVRAQVLFVHGFIEHVERYDHAFPRFADKGISVFAYDQRGFGRTATYTPKHTQGRTSWPQQLEDIEFWLKHAQSLNPDVPLFLYGHSMGGALSLAFSLGRCTSSPTSHPHTPSPLLSSLSGVLISSPLLRQSPSVKASPLIVRAGSLLGKVSGSLTLKAPVKAEDCTRDPVAREAYVNDPLCKQQGTFRGVADMLLGGESLMTHSYKHWPPTLPLLIVHGTADKVTDPKASEEFVGKVKNEVGAKDATFKPFEGYFHEMHNEPGEDKNVEIDFLADWIVSHLPSNPSSSSTGPTTTAAGTAAAGAGASELPAHAHEAVDAPVATTNALAVPAAAAAGGEAPASAAGEGEERESKL
ncbi:hypothetical protein JCM6882_000108 [Rhodosporidiobolus microsporus]